MRAVLLLVVLLVAPCLALADFAGRVVACAGIEANSEQVRRGMAWAFKRYVPVGSALYEIETYARLRRLGLWGDPRPVAPWEWRAKRGH